MRLMELDEGVFISDLLSNRCCYGRSDTFDSFKRQDRISK